MSYASIMLNSAAHLPEGSICVGEVCHPADVRRGDDPEVLRCPVLRLASGVEVLWQEGTVRSLPRTWRKSPGAIDYATDHLLSVAEVAEEMGVHPSRVKALLQEGRLAGARKIGRDWIVPRVALELFNPKPEGRPRKIVRD